MSQLAMPDLHPAAKPRRREPRRVLLVQYSGNYGGSTISARLIVEGLLGAGWGVDIALGVDGPYAPIYAGLGAQVHVVPHRNWLRHPGYLRFARDGVRELAAASPLLKLIREIRPESVYVNSLASLAGVVAAKRAGVPSVWHLRELLRNVGGEAVLPRGATPVFRRVLQGLPDRLVAVSRAVAVNLLGVPSHPKLDTVPNAAGVEFFENDRTMAECREQLGLPRKATIIGVPGTLRPVKGHGFFLEAAARLPKALRAVFAITGTGDPAHCQTLQTEIRGRGLSDQVEMLGTVADMPGFYRACDLVCLPSRSESFGRTAIEAFAAGTPVVGTSVGGLADIVTDGVSGLLVPYGDVAQLAQSLTRLLADEPLRHRLAVRGRAEAEERYHPRLYQDRILRIIEETIASR